MSHKVELIAELATNFGGSESLARHFIKDFTLAGVDTIKFQLCDWRNLRSTDPQYDWFRQHYFPLEQLRNLKRYCDECGVGFLVTAYTPADVDRVRNLTYPFQDRIKIGSAEAHSKEMATAVRKAGFKETLVSFGLSHPETCPFDNPVRLACVTRYPAPIGLAGVMMQSGYYQGWSDHSEGLNECKAAIVAGARIVEFHVQLPNQARPPKSFEKTVEEVRELREFANDDPVRRFVGRWSNA